jgi:hypothetical protein
VTLPDITALLVASVTVLLIAYDVWVRIKDPTGDATISWVFLQAAKKWPTLAFALGFLIGHVLMQNCTVN